MFSLANLASFISRRQPLATITPTNECLHSWNLNDYRVDLIRIGGALKYELVKYGGVIKENDIAIPPSKNIEEMIASLKKCCALLDKERSVYFSYVYCTKSVEDHAVSLIRGEGDLMWKIYNVSTLEYDIISFKAFTIPSLHCHPDTIALVESICREPLRLEHIEYLVNDFKIVRIKNYHKEMTSATRVNATILASAVVAAGISPIFLVPMAVETAASFGNKNIRNEIISSYTQHRELFEQKELIVERELSEQKELIVERELSEQKELIVERELSEQNELIVEIAPICFPSFFDPRVFVSKFTWAVTLVTHCGSAGSHTEIIIEGINDGFFNENSNKLYRGQNVAIGEKFTYLAHFTGTRIDCGLVSEKEMIYETRTEIWMRPRDKMKTLIKNIEADTVPAFAYAGKDALHAKGAHNCFTWAREHFQVADIFLGKSLMGKICTYPKNYTAKPEYYLRQPVKIQI